MTTALWRFYAAAGIQGFGVALGFFSVTLNATLLGASPIVLGAVLGAGTALSYALACQATGRLVVRWGPKPVFVLGCLGMGTLFGSLALPRSLWIVVPQSIVAGASMSLYWPALMAWISHGRTSDELGTILPQFNFTWGSAAIAGPVIGGLLIDRAPPLAFMVTGCVMAAPLLALATAPNVHPSDLPPRPEGEDGGGTTYFWILGLAANFLNFFLLGLTRNLFPKLGLALDFTPTLVGVLFFFISLCQMLTFAVLRASDFWRFRMWPTLGTQLLAVGAMLVIWRADSPLAFAAAFGLIGLNGGISYNASLYYSLHAGQGGRGSSIHETTLATGSMLGPLVGGVLGQIGVGVEALRAPYLCAAAVLVAAIVAQLAWLRPRLVLQRPPRWW